MAAFKPVSVVFCDFVSQDHAGKANHLGISQEELRFPTAPPMLTQMFIVATIKPLSKRFKYIVDFDAPDGSRIIRLTASCETEGDYPPRHSISTNLQTPAIPFPGEGEYAVKIRDESLKVVFTQLLHIGIGQPLDIKLNFDGKVEVGEKYAQMEVVQH
ncbi:hypothetical protein HFN60_32970 [Rhizobium leguminosarum]|uniref:DUF6941 family protein n=1 Tax=Rhizobium leguminosarum TaxID=384 RepID=UPI001C96F07A|nr:hypothetical protein [Rhizobium leguminosarum]MBY5820403.1 hypothetical protein [Rhizobium leguminosarum]